MTQIPLTTDMMIVFGVMLAAVILFIVDWMRVDIVAILIMVILPVLGVIDGSESFSGLSSTAVVSIIAVIIIGRGLDHTGVVSSFVRPLVKLTGQRRSRTIALLSMAVAFISSVMQNIGAAALFLPAIRRISRKSRIPLSRLLMPIGFAAILGGTITLVGSSPLIMLNDLMSPYGIEPLGLFSVMPVGVALVVVGILYFVIFGNRMLPNRFEEEGEMLDTSCPAVRYYTKLGDLIEIAVPEDFAAGPAILDLCDRFRVHTVAVLQSGEREALVPPPREMLISPGSFLAVYAQHEDAEAAARFYGVDVRPQLERFSDILSDEYFGLVEAVVPPHSKFIGQPLKDIHFRHNYLVAPIAIYREDDVCYTSLGEQVLHTGDAMLMYGRWEQFQLFRRKRDLIFSHTFDHEILHPNKAVYAVACFALATAMVFFTSLKLSVCLMAGALGMVLTRVITIDEAYNSVDWRTVFLLAGLIPLGVAMEKTGAAAFLSHHLLALLGAPSRLTFLFSIGLMSTFFTLVVSNVGATVLLVPLVISTAQVIGVDPRTAALVVGISTSNAFILPTHQVNALYMGAGRYRSGDFLKAGTPLSLIFLVVVVSIIYFFY